MLMSLNFTPEWESSNVRIEHIYNQQKTHNTISAISVPHHIETNMGRWIHISVVQNEEVYDPSNLRDKKITATKEHSIYIYNPSLDKVIDLSEMPLDQLIPQEKQPVLMRIHSLCRFGDSFGSLMCDCGPQLVAAKRAILSNGSGMIIYLEQEGRNAGLTAKAAAYRLDAVEKIPTDKTFNKLGLDRNDLRDYHVVLDIFSVFKINKAELMTNNPKKFDLLKLAGKEIIQRPISIPATEHNLNYLRTKKNAMGHAHLNPEKKSSDENHIKIAHILNEIPQVINEKNMSIFQKLVEVANSLEYCPFFDEVTHPEFHFLSNFYESPICSSLGDFKCSEGLYQYQKLMHLNDSNIREMFQKADGQTAYNLSRKLGSMTVGNWDKIAAMKLALRAKFNDLTLKEKLVATGSAYLVENSPKGHDPFWSDNGDGTGANMMGILLMEIREESGGTGVVAIPQSLKILYGEI